MTQAIVNMAKALGQLINERFASGMDRETLELINALAAWVEKHQKR